MCVCVCVCVRARAYSQEYHHYAFPKVTSCFCCMVTKVARATVCCGGNSFIQRVAADSVYTLLKAVPMCWMLIVSTLAVVAIYTHTYYSSVVFYNKVGLPCE